MKIQICSTFAKSSLSGALVSLLIPAYCYAEGEFVFLLRAKGNPYWNSVAAAVEETAQKTGIPVAELDASIPLEEAEKAGVKLAFSVGSDNLEIGRKAAEYAKSIFTQGVLADSNSPALR